MTTLGIVALVLAVAGLGAGFVGLRLAWPSKPPVAPPEPRKREYKVKAYIETDNSLYSDGKTRTKVIVHNSEYDPRYPTLHKNDYEFVGSCDPLDRDGVSRLMVVAEARRDELEDSLNYAKDAADALNM